MKRWLSLLTVVSTAAVLMATAACSSGGNVDDTDGMVSNASVTDGSSTNMISSMMENVESSLGIDTSSTASATESK